VGGGGHLEADGNAGDQVALVVIDVFFLGAQGIADEADPLREPDGFKFPAQLLGE
jgi:hypothetical protein